MHSAWPRGLRGSYCRPHFIKLGKKRCVVLLLHLLPDPPPELLGSGRVDRSGGGGRRGYRGGSGGVPAERFPRGPTGRGWAGLGAAHIIMWGARAGERCGVARGAERHGSGMRTPGRGLSSAGCALCGRAARAAPRFSRCCTGRLPGGLGRLLPLGVQLGLQLVRVLGAAACEGRILPGWRKGTPAGCSSAWRNAGWHADQLFPHPLLLRVLPWLLLLHAPLAADALVQSETFVQYLLAFKDDEGPPNARGRLCELAVRLMDWKF